MKRFLIFLILSLVLTSLHANQIWSVAAFKGKNYFDTNNYSTPKTINGAKIYQWKENQNVFIYEPVGASYKLIALIKKESAYLGDYYFDVFPDEENQDLRVVIIPEGLVIIGVINDGNTDAVVIPAEMNLDGYTRDVVYIDEKVLVDFKKIEFGKGKQGDNSEKQIIFNNTGVDADFHIACQVRFLKPLSSERMQNVTFDKDLTVYPCGLYSYEDDELIIPSQFKMLPDDCFLHSKKPLFISLPESLEYIGESCFFGSALTSLRLPYYLKKIGNSIIANSAVTKVYFPWQGAGPRMVFSPLVFVEQLQSNTASYYIPSNINVSEISAYFGDTDNGLVNSIVAPIKSKIKYCDYIYHWSGDSVKSVIVPNGVFTDAPEIEANELLVVTPSAGVEEGTNIILADKQNTFRASHLQFTATGSNPTATKFCLPFDTYCDTLSVITDQTGYWAMKLPCPCVSDGAGWVGHRYNSETGTYLASDTLDAGGYILAMRATTGEQDLILSRNKKNKGPLIKATTANEPLIDLRDVSMAFDSKPIVGYPHATSVAIPRIAEDGSYEINSLGELYFFQNYAPYAQGTVTLQRDLFLPIDDIWTPIRSFNKKFDGRGHVISGMRVVPLAAGRNAGMFERLGKEGDVMSLYLKGTVRGVGDESYNNVGGVVGYSEGQVHFCVIDMDVCINANAAATVMGKAASYEQTPGYNLILGRVVFKAYKRYYGLILGNVSDFVIGTKVSDFIRTLASNCASNTAYVQCGNEPESKYFTPINNASLLYSVMFMQRDYIISNIQSMTKSNVFDLTKEIHTGQLASNIVRYSLAQNVSKLMAPLDSIPFPSIGPLGKPYVKRTNTGRNKYLTYHNCADYVGGNKCPLCDKETATVSAIEIGTAEELRSFAQMVNSATSPQYWYARLTADIDLENKEWTPIGNNTDLNYDSLSQSSVHCEGLAFRGIFDGKGHTIQGLNVNGTSNCGLFGVLHDNALVCNLVLRGSVKGSTCVGSVAGLMSRSEISSVISYVEVQGEAYTGGLVGAMTGSHAYLANSVWLGKVTDNGGDKPNKCIGRLIGKADIRALGWDIQPIKLQNIYLPAAENEKLFNIGSNQVPNQNYVEYDTVYFHNDSVNKALKAHFYDKLLSAQYLLTSAKLMPSLVVDSDHHDQEEPSDPIDGPECPDDPAAPQDPVRVGDWYEVATATQLIKLAELVNNDPKTPVKARLTRDINLSNVAEWMPIGIKGFSGTFDGQNHSIRGLSISKEKYTYSGLFGKLDNAQVCNLMVYGKGITANSFGGAIAGFATQSSNITNCLVDCPVTGTSVKYVGGIVGSLATGSQVANCLVLSSVQNTSSADNYGMIVGTASRCIIRNSLARDADNRKLLGNASDKKVEISDCDYAVDDSLASGAIAYRMYEKSLPYDMSPWGQTFGTDTVPKLGAKRVYCGTPEVDYDYCNIDKINYTADSTDFDYQYIAHRLTLDNTIDSIRVPDMIASLKAVELYHKRKYVRGFNSICLPGSLPADAITPEDYELGYLKEVNIENGKCKLTFAATQELNANQPGIFFLADESSRNECKEVEILLNAYRHNNAVLYNMPLTDTHPTDGFDNVTLYGAYKTKAIGGGHYKLNADGDELVTTQTNSHVYPYHWYLDITDTGATRAIFSIEPPQTEIPATSEEEPTYYDLTGRRIDGKTHQGIRVWHRGKSLINK